MVNVDAVTKLAVTRVRCTVSPARGPWTAQTGLESMQADSVHMLTLATTYKATPVPYFFYVRECLAV